MKERMMNHAFSNTFLLFLSLFWNTNYLYSGSSSTVKKSYFTQLETVQILFALRQKLPNIFCFPQVNAL